MSADTIAQPVPDSVTDLDSRNQVRARRVTAVWAVLCLLALLWWAAHYASIVEWLAEWQFATFGRYYPSVTVVLVVLLLTVPTAALLAWARRRRRRKVEEAEGHVDPVARVIDSMASAIRSRIFFLGIAVVSALVALGVALSILTLPRGDGPLRTIVGTARAIQPEGAARFAPGFGTGRVARIEENVGLARRVMYVAPVRLTRNDGGAHFLTEMDRLPPPGLRFRPIPSGVLVARGLPRELQNLYREVGVDVPNTAFFLVRDDATVRWRAIVLSVQMALLALLAFAVAFLFERQAKRLEETLGEEAGRSQQR